MHTAAEGRQGLTAAQCALCAVPAHSTYAAANAASYERDSRTINILCLSFICSAALKWIRSDQWYGGHPGMANQHAEDEADAGAGGCSAQAHPTETRLRNVLPLSISKQEQVSIISSKSSAQSTHRASSCYAPSNAGHAAGAASDQNAHIGEVMLTWCEDIAAPPLGLH
jgi:hypothetical protein